MTSQKGDNLVFILSLPRSGSTLLSALLGQHSAVLAPPEPWFLLPLSQLRCPQDPGAAYGVEHARLATAEFLDQASFVASARDFAATAYRRELEQGGRRIFVDKTPRYYHILDFLDALFPRAKMIWLRRNPLDIAASYKQTWGVTFDELSGKVVTPNTFDFAHGLFRLADYFERDDPRKIRMDYESVVADPVREMRRLSSFLGLDFEPVTGRFARGGTQIERLRRASSGDRKILATRRVHGQSVGKWKTSLNRTELTQLLALLGPRILRRTGYETVLPQLEFLRVSIPTERTAAACRSSVMGRRSPAQAGTDHAASEVWSRQKAKTANREKVAFNKLAKTARDQARYVATLETQRVRFQNEQSRFREEYDRLTAETASIRIEGKRAAMDSQKHIDSLKAQLDRTVAESQKHIDCLKGQFDRNVLDHQNTIERLKTQLSQLAKTSLKQTEFIATLRSERDRVAKQAVEATTEAEARVANAQKHIDSLQAQLERSARDHQNTIDPLKNQLDQLAATSTKQSEFIATLQVERDRVARQAAAAGADAQARLATSQQHIDALRAQLDQIAKTVEEQTRYISLLEKERERVALESRPIVNPGADPGSVTTGSS